MKRVDFGDFEFDRSDRDLEREPRKWRTLTEIGARMRRARSELDHMKTQGDAWSRFTSMWGAIGALHRDQVTTKGCVDV